MLFYTGSCDSIWLTQFIAFLAPCAGDTIYSSRTDEPKGLVYLQFATTHLLPCFSDILRVLLLRVSIGLVEA